MAVLAFALYALAVEGHAGADDARAALAGLRARYGDDCDVRSVWDECLQWSFGPDPTDGWWRMGRMRLYCLVAGYYLGLLEGEERDRYLERTPFRRCGSDGVLLSRAFQQLEFAMPVAPDTPVAPDSDTFVTLMLSEIGGMSPFLGLDHGRDGSGSERGKKRKPSGVESGGSSWS